jgi:hypothetical protein
MVILNFVTNVVEAWINPDHTSENTTLIMSKVLRSYPHAYSARSYCIGALCSSRSSSPSFLRSSCAATISRCSRACFGGTRGARAVCSAVRRRSIGSESTRRSRWGGGEGGCVRGCVCVWGGGGLRYCRCMECVVPPVAPCVAMASVWCSQCLLRATSSTSLCRDATGTFSTSSSWSVPS